jgi:hypothetical protein
MGSQLTLLLCIGSHLGLLLFMGSHLALIFCMGSQLILSLFMESKLTLLFCMGSQLTLLFCMGSHIALLFSMGSHIALLFFMGSQLTPSSDKPQTLLTHLKLLKHRNIPLTNPKFLWHTLNSYDTETLCYRSLRCVRGDWGVSEECFCVIGVWGVSEEFGVCQRSVSLLRQTQNSSDTP